MQVGFNLSDDINMEPQHDPSFPYFEMCDAWLADAQHLAKKYRCDVATVVSIMQLTIRRKTTSKKPTKLK